MCSHFVIRQNSCFLNIIFCDCKSMNFLIIEKTKAVVYRESAYCHKQLGIVCSPHLPDFCRTLTIRN